MPLPGNGLLSLQHHSNPGDTQQSKPKQAMIVRMSAETLEALENFPNQPRMEFEFGDNPGIYIGDTFFPMRALKEGSPHELYLRTHSVNKPNAPLKLYANVTGKFTVERELGEKVQDKVRDRTQIAEKQRVERKTILLDAPLTISRSAGAKKRKEPTMLRKPPPMDAHRNLSASSSTQPRKSASPLPPPTQDRDSRRRLIHCVALNPRTTDEVMRLVGGAACDASTRRELKSILDDVAECTPAAKNSTDQSPPRWSLKTRSWLEVRPYKWPGLTSAEQTKLRRQAGLALNALKIPESDPAWVHVRFNRESESASGSRDPKANGATSGAFATRDTAKLKKSKPAEGTKRKAADTITAKDEGARSIRVDVAKGKARDTEDSSGAGTPTLARAPARRLPGSGFKAKAGSLTPSPATEMSPGPSQPTKRAPAADGREGRKEAPLLPPSLPPKPAPPITERKVSNTSSASSAAPMRMLKKTKEAQVASSRVAASDRDREIEPDTSAPASAGLKRKKAAREDPDQDFSERDGPSSFTKKRRLDEAPNGGPRQKERPKELDLSLPKKPVFLESMPSPRPKVKREPSPLPPPRSPMVPRASPRPPAKPLASGRERAPSTASSVSHSARKDPAHPSQSQRANGVAKARRKSPIYTSSEDEKATKRKVDPAPARNREDPPPPPRAAGTLAKKPAARRSRVPLVLPDDAAGLRRLYKAKYPGYIMLYQQHVNAFYAIDKLLRREGHDVTDSDADAEMLSPEELATLKNELSLAKEELETIRSAHAKLKGMGRASGSVSDGE